MRCTFGQLGEFKGHILVILPPKIAKSRAMMLAIYTALCKLVH